MLFPASETAPLLQIPGYAPVYSKFGPYENMYEKSVTFLSYFIHVTEANYLRNLTKVIHQSESDFILIMNNVVSTV